MEKEKRVLRRHREGRNSIESNGYFMLTSTCDKTVFLHSKDIENLVPVLWELKDQFKNSGTELNPGKDSDRGDTDISAMGHEEEGRGYCGGADRAGGSSESSRSVGKISRRVGGHS